MVILETISFRNRDEWRSWLAANHNKKKDVWLFITRKKAEKDGLKLQEAVEEALCFGWIDSKMKSFDNNRFILRFSKRNPHSIWSKINQSRVQKMIELEKMTEAGLISVEEAKINGTWNRAYTSKVNPIVPKDLEEILNLNPSAKERFMTLTNSTKLQLIVWIEGAKRLETRKKRINECLRRVQVTKLKN